MNSCTFYITLLEDWTLKEQQAAAEKTGREGGTDRYFMMLKMVFRALSCSSDCLKTRFTHYISHHALNIVNTGEDAVSAPFCSTDFN
jgi:hypothetical protein